MSNLASFSVINYQVEKIFKEEGSQSKGIAFANLCLKTLFKLTDEEVEEAVTDGPMDGEVDAIYICDRIVHILTFKYTDRFDLTKKNYPETDLDQFILSVDSIISGKLNQATINDAVWEKYQEIYNLISTGRVEFKIYVVSNKLYPVPHAQTKFADAIDKFKIVDTPIYLDQEDLVSIILENKGEQVNGRIQFIDTQHFEKSNGNIRTVIGAVGALDFIDLIKNEDGSVKENAFNENIRVYKPTHRVNKAIIDSALSDNNFQFFYLNNGVTILCQNVDYTPNSRSPYVDIANFQIINGGQTSHSLFEVYKNDRAKLSSIELLLRICEIKKDDLLSEKISETSNNQIPVGNRDLHSNDMIQKKLEDQFASIGYYYERKPNQYKDKPKDRILNNELLGQLFMAYHLDMPSEAKNSKVKVFSDMYDQIFDEKIIEASELIKLKTFYTPLLEMKKNIQSKKRKKQPINEKEAFVSRATFHILYGLKLIYENAICQIENEDIPESDKKRKIADLYDKKRQEYTQIAIDMIYKVVLAQVDLRGDLYTHDKFFKEIPTNNLIKMYFLKELKDNPVNIDVSS